jgi:poly(3-hydroxybutyrate) depolymerase
MDLPAFHNLTHFTAYIEGWALYAEQLAWELGFYEGDPYGNLGRLQAEAFRAVRLVVDTGIHAKGWTYDEAVNYMIENTGLSRGMVEFEISRYMVWPGQATAYKIGMLQILAMRQRVMDELGDAFDLKEFHNVVLGSGALPLEILERIVDAYIESKLAAGQSIASGPTLRPLPSPTIDRTALYQAPGDFGDVLESGGRQRRFKVHIPPSYHPDKPTPLVLCFHGGGGTMREIEQVSEMSVKADESGFIVVYPQAAAHRNTPPRWYTTIEEENHDVQFIRDLLEHLGDRLSLDPARIYATGYSNGGTFSDSLGCQLSGHFAAIASVVGSHAEPIAACAPEREIAILILCDAHQCAPSTAGPDWAPHWVDRYGCDPTPAVSVQQETVTRKSWANCPGESTVTLYTFFLGGHTWFKEPIRATDLIWAFFEQQAASARL